LAEVSQNDLDDYADDIQINASLRLAEKTLFQDQRAIPGLAKAIKHKKSEIYSLGATYLAKISGETSVEILINEALLESNPDKVRVQVINALGLTHDRSALWALDRILWDRNGSFSVEAMHAIVAIGGKLATPELIRVLSNHPSTVTRGEAAKLLGKIRSPQALEALETAAKDANQVMEVRRIALHTLGAVGDRTILELLKKWLNHNDFFGLRNDLAETIARMNKRLNSVP
jgi:HEAT repeat protein